MLAESRWKVRPLNLHIVHQPLLGAESYAGKFFLVSAVLGGRNGGGRVKTRGLPEWVGAGATKGYGSEHVHRGITLTLGGWGHTVSAHWLEPRAQAHFPGYLDKSERRIPALSAKFAIRATKSDLPTYCAARPARESRRTK